MTAATLSRQVVPPHAVLNECVLQVGARSAVGYVLGFQARWVRLRDDQLVGSDGLPVDLAEVYEARLFGPTQHGDGTFDLRWIRTPESGRAELLQTAHEVVPGIEHFEQGELTCQLLWGASLGTDSSGWSVLNEPRITAFAVPVALQIGQRVQLTGREYTRTDPHGNVSVVAEMLLGLEGI